MSVVPSSDKPIKTKQLNHAATAQQLELISSQPADSKQVTKEKPYVVDKIGRKIML